MVDDNQIATSRGSLTPHGRRRLVQGLVDRAMVGTNGQSKPALQLTECQYGLTLRIIITPLRWIGKGCPRQIMDHLHRRTDDAFHDTAVVRATRRAITQLNAVLFATTA